MTEEEKKAIAIFKSYINAIETFGTIDYKCINNLYEPAITLLNLITKLRQENEELTTALSKQSKDIGNYLVELQQKDKQIDLMAEFINKQDIDEDICKNNMSDLCDEFGTGINCIKCIKQYFEKLAKEKKIKYE